MLVNALAELGPALVVAPHPDDEVLGCGGTIALLADAGCAVHVAVMTTGRPPRFDPEGAARVRDEATRAHELLGVSTTHWLDLPAAALDTYPHADANDALSALVRDMGIKTLLLPHPGDVHLDHQRTFLSGLVAARPHQSDYPKAVLAYETLSETNWNAPYLSPAFQPNVFVDISDVLDRKLDAFAAFASQTRMAPHERSPSTIRALATLRGATVHRDACEAFVAIRLVL